MTTLYVFDHNIEVVKEDGDIRYLPVKLDSTVHQQIRSCLGTSDYKIIKVEKMTCEACMFDQPSQWAHMEPGGCLDINSS